MLKHARMKLLFAAFLVLLHLPGCAPKPEPALDEATVVAKNASLRLKNSATSRTLVLLESGDKVDVLERQENWYRVRYRDVQGWMEESTVLTNETKDRIQRLIAESQSLEPQNTATLKQDANLRLEPGRSTSIIRRAESGATVEVLDRVTKPRPGSDNHEMWVKVRLAPTEVGWLLASSLEFDIPNEIAQYSEGYVYAAVKMINRVQDPLAGQINWYVIGERKSVQTLLPQEIPFYEDRIDEERARRGEAGSGVRGQELGSSTSSEKETKRWQDEGRAERKEKNASKGGGKDK